MAHIIVLGAGLGGSIMAFEMKDQLRPEDTLTVINKGSNYSFVPSNPWVAVGWREKEEIEVEGNTIEVIDADKINGYVETVVEEADTEEFTKNLDTNKKKAAGTAKQPDLAKGDVQAVKNEEVEQLDEISKKTLGSYVKKASEDSRTKTREAMRTLAPQIAKGFKGRWNKEKADQQAAAQKLSHKSFSRQSGIEKAVDRLTREETEQMDEVAPPGREKQVKALKKVPGISNPWAVSWASYRKSHPKKKD